MKNPWTHEITTRKSLDPRNAQEKKFWTNEIQRHDGTDPPDPRNLVHFVRMISKRNQHMETMKLKDLKQKRFTFFIFQAVK